MFTAVLQLLAQHYSGGRALRHVEELARLQRVSAGPGLRAAAAYCYDALRSSRLKAELLRFPADGKTSYWSMRMPLEWHCRAGRLRLVSAGPAGELLADFAADRMSVAQGSGPTPPEGIEADLVALDDGLREEQWPDVRGKLLLARGPTRPLYEEAVRKGGALGILFDGGNEGDEALLDLPDARPSVRFDWAAGETPCLGLVLTPRQGHALRRLLRRQPVRLWAQVDARLSDGLLDLASATLPGQSEQEVLVIAALDGPQPSASLATGAAAVLEVAQVLAELVAAGALARPRRTIRFLLTPHVYGLPAYLADDERRRQRVLAAINLDLVGASRAERGSPLLVQGLPHAVPAPLAVLAGAMLEALSASRAAPTYQAGVPFSGAGDEALLCDPLVGIPCPAVRRRPPGAAGTSADAATHVDPESLQEAGLLAACYIYFVANAGADEAVWLAYEAQTRYRAALARLAQDACTQMRLALLGEGERGDKARSVAATLDDLQRMLLYRSERQQAALAWLERLGGPDLARPLAILQSEAATAAWHEHTAAADIAGGLAARAGLAALPRAAPAALGEWEQAAAEIVPMRRQPGPVRLAAHLTRLSPEQRTAWQAVTSRHAHTPPVVLDLALFWADGKRTLLEIAHLVELETGRRDVGYLVQYMRLLKELELLA